MAENEKAGNNGQQDFTKFLILTISSIVIMFVVFAGVNYVVMENLITQKIGSLNTSQEELGEEGGDEDQIQKGIIVDLGDFILNLCDESQKKYLKVNVAIEVTKKDTDFPEAEPAKGGGHGGHGDTDNHLMLVDLTGNDVSGKELEKRLDDAHITCNKNTIPNDPKSPFVTSGIRLGTASVTSRGMKTEDMDDIAEAIALMIKNGEDSAEEVKAIVKKLTDKYPLK